MTFTSILLGLGVLSILLLSLGAFLYALLNTLAKGFEETQRDGFENPFH